MGHIFSVIFYLLIIVFSFVSYLKTKKAYWVLTIIMFFMGIYLQTPFASGISKASENIMVGILVIIMFIIFYLLIKEEKEKNKEK